MSITERLANLQWYTVIITVVVLLAIRFGLLKYYKTPFTKSIAEIAESLAVAMALVFLLIRPFLVQAFFIPSASMHPTLLEHDHILVNKLVYRFTEPKLADVIVFKAPPEANPPGDTTEKDFIKRVIGVPGDTVRITPGYVVVGQNQYNHSTLRDMLSGFGSPNGHGRVRLAKGMVMVDGRAVSNAEVAAAAGFPGAKVKVVPGTVYINGKAIREPYIAEDPDDPYPGSGKGTVPPDEWVVTKGGVQYVKIPEGKLLVMGDNRNDSNDARFWGLLDRERVLGKAMFIFWPPSRVRWVR